MHREYHRWFSRSLHRDTDLLVIGHAGPPMQVFPTSMGAVYEFEDRGMVAAVGDKLAHGGLRLFCVFSGSEPCARGSRREADAAIS